jgi:hypothetical protein
VSESWRSRRRILGTPPGEIVVVAGCDVYDENDFVDGVIFTVTAAPAGAVITTPQLTG